MQDGILLATDAIKVGAKGLEVLPDAVNADPEAAHRSVGKISCLEVEDIYVGHGPKTTIGAMRKLVEQLEV